MNRNPMKISAALEVVSPDLKGASERRIHKAQIARLERVRGKTVECVEGRLWVTQPGDPVDYILGAGDKLAIASRGTVLVEAIVPSRYAVDQ